jgi:glycosyltransferase involved in cell wall biosynthesis
METDEVQKKKILIFVPEFPRLTETFIQREISGLIALGNIEVTVFSLRKAPGELLANISGHVSYRKLNAFLLFKAWIYFLLKDPRKIVRIAKSFLSFKENGFAGDLLFFAKSVGYAYLFLQNHPDHIHANFMSWPSTMAMIASQLLDIPYSISAHAKDVMVEGEYFVSKVATAKFISICNKFAYEDCINRCGKKAPSNVFLQYHGIDLAHTFGSVPPAKKGDKLFLFNGGTRLVEKKGQKYLIEAAEILKSKGLDFELHIAGPGPLYGELVDQIRKLGLQENVFIHGNGDGIPFNEVVAYLKACDIVVQANINLDSGDADGVPTFIIESAMLGKPIIATDAGSITELIFDKKTGLLVPQRDSKALAEAILKLTKEDPAFGISLGKAAREKALEIFDLEKNIKELERLLIQ